MKTLIVFIIFAAILFGNSQENTGIEEYNKSVFAAADGNYKEEMKHLEKAIKYGHIEANCMLASMYFEGLGTAINHQKAFDLFKNGADKGSAVCSFNLAILYDKKLDYYNALLYYEKSCESGYGVACRNLAIRYDNGFHIDKDHMKALKYYIQACDAGDARSCNNAGTKFLIGTVITQDIKTGVMYCKKSCDLGHDLGCENYKNWK